MSARNEGESFSDYRIRKAAEQKELNIYMKGRPFIQGKGVNRTDVRNYENKSIHHGSQNNMSGKVLAKRHYLRDLNKV